MSSQIIIVDENDQQIGLKERSQLNHPQDIYRVAALWLTNSRGEILLAQRKLTKDKDPGKWGPAAAGTIDDGETYESNIYKEAAEEIGLTSVNFTKGPKLEVTGIRHYFTQWYFATADIATKDLVLQDDEVEQVAWVAPGVLLRDITEHPDQYVQGLGMVVHTFITARN